MAKIAIVLSSLSGGGAERVATNLATYWQQRSNHTVHIITLAASDRDAYVLPEGIRRKSLNLYSDSSGLVQAIRNNVHRVSAIRAELSEIHPDCVLSFLPEVNVLTTLASVGKKYRLVLSERNYAPRESLPRYWRFLRKRLYGNADAVVTQTQKGARWLKENTNASNTVVIPNIASIPKPVSSDSVIPTQFISQSEKFVLAAGRIDVQKGFDILIRAFAIASKQKLGWKLLIAGDSQSKTHKEELLKLVDDASLQDQVNFVGRVNNMEAWYRASHIFVLSSRFEGFPNALLEAMACGCAVISTDCDTGPSDIIQQAINGLLVEPENVDAMAKAMVTLMDDASTRESLGRAAINVCDEFAEPKVMRLWDSALKL